jgi:hypothetical protein
LIIIRALAFLLFFTVIPFAVGRLITYRARTGLITDYLIGFFGNLGIFYVLYSIVAWIQMWITFNEPVTGAFSILLRLYFAVLSVLILLWIFMERKNITGIISCIKEKIQTLINNIREDKFVIIYIIFFAGLLLLQLYIAFSYQVNQWSYDDYDYVVSSKDTITYDALSYVNFVDGTMPNTLEKRLSISWNTYIAMLSKVSGFEVTTVCHTLLPVIMLLVAYLVYYYIAKFLFRRTDNRIIFLIILSVAYIFGLYSHYSVTFRLLGALWQGKAILTVIAIPFFILYLFKAYSGENTKMTLPIIAISLGASSLTSLAILFIPIVAVLVWFCAGVSKKRVGGFVYLFASLFGPLYLAAFYILIWMLQRDVTSGNHKYFPFRQRNDWWYKWFH